MYKMLNAEMAKKNITLKQLSEFMDVSYETIRLKLKGDYPITLGEAKQIKDILKSDMTLELLFSAEGA